MIRVLIVLVGLVLLPVTAIAEGRCPPVARGAATGRLTKAAASRDAEAVCVSSGGAPCKVAFTYKNQCAAASVPTTGDGGTSFGRGATVEIAEKISLDLCAKGGGVGCRKIYSACAEPQFESF